jgi:thiamine-phosphate diphosphorylase/hydroxyethylthiazole kinase
MHGSISQAGHGLDGVAVVSDIVASSDPMKAARLLKSIFVACKKTTLSLERNYTVWSRDDILDKAATIMDAVRALNPLVHQVRLSVPFYALCSNYTR